MSNNDDISANIGLDLTDYTRNIQRGIRQADDFDAALDSLIDSANKAEKQLQELSGDIDIKLDTDYRSLLEADSALQALDTSVTAEIDANLTGLNAAASALTDLSTPLDVPIDLAVTNDASIRSLLDGLAAPLQTKINVDDSEVGTANKAIGDVDDTINVKVNADTSAMDGVAGQLETLKQLAVIDLVMNVADLPEQIPLLGAIADQDKARRVITAGTGDTGNADLYAAGAEDVFASNFGADREEAARGYMDVVRQTKDETGELATTGEEFGNITKDAFATAAQSGEDFNSVLAAADTLVQTGLAPSYSEAFDLINNGFQEGLNKGNDFLDTIKEYSGQFADLGFSATEFFSTLSGGLEAGAFNTDFVADLVKEFNIRAQAAATKGGAEFDYFKAIGMSDEVKAFNAGELTGQEFFSGVVQAAASGEFDPQQIFDVLGTKAEDLTLDAVIQLDPSQVKAEIASYSGATMEVSAQLGGDLPGSVETLRRTIESELATSVSNAFDIPGKIQQLSDGVSEFSEQLDLGKSIPEAIEIAFQLPGFAETVATLESALGNLTISVLEAAANILEGLGQGDAAAGIRGAVTQYAPGQLAFDLQFADTEAEVQAAITRGVNRGLEASDIKKTLVSTGEEMLASGDLEGTREFLTLLEGIATKQADIQATGGVQGLLGSLAGSVPLPDVSALQTVDETQTAAQFALGPLEMKLAAQEDAITTHYETLQFMAEDNLAGMSEATLTNLAPVELQVSTLGDVFTTTDLAFATTATNAVTNAEVMGTAMSTASTSVDTFASNADMQFNETTVTALDNAELKMTAFGETVLNTMLKAGEDVQSLIDKLLSIGSLDITMPGVGFTAGEPPKGGIAGEAVGGIIPKGSVAEVHHGELAAMGDDVSILNRQTSGVIESAIAQFMAGGGSGGGSVVNNYNTISVVFNTSGAAATTAAMDSTKSIRGF